MPLKIVPQRDRKLNRLFKEGEELVLSRGTPIYDVGSPADRLYLVRRGHVRLTLPPDGNGHERTAAVAGPWELFGEESLIGGIRRSYAALAGEPVTLTAVEGDDALRAIRGTGRTLPHFLEAASLDLLRARWSSPGGSGPSTSERLADLLLELADRFGKTDGSRIRIPHWFTHEELADLVGAHRSTVTTQLNEWIYEGLLDSDSSRMVITRPQALDARGSGREGWLVGR